MRVLLTILMVSGLALGQASNTAEPADTTPQAASAAPPNAAGQAQGKDLAARPAGAALAQAADPNATVIPAGTKIPLLLKQAISTKNAREGDAVYAETAFPFVVNDRMLIPAGTYIQGEVLPGGRQGRGRGGPETRVHFCSSLFPRPYPV